MFVYAGTTYRATISGATAVAVRCEQCQKKYYYELYRTVSASSEAPYGLGAEGARKRARKRARDKLRQLLENDIEAVPCPYCGAYQERMFPLFRRPRLRALKNLGIITAATGVGLTIFPVFLLSEFKGRDSLPLPVVFSPWGFAALAFLASITLFVVRRHKNALYNPNDPETEQERIELGRELTITKEQAEALMEEQGG